MTGRSADEAEKEVKVAIQRVFHWAAYTDKYGGTVQVREWIRSTIDTQCNENMLWFIMNLM